MESVKICYFKTFRAGNFALRTFCCYFLQYIHFLNLFCEDISVGYELKSEKLKGRIDGLKIKQFRPKWKHNGFKRAHANIITYIVYTICDGIS